LISADSNTKGKKLSIREAESNGGTDINQMDGIGVEKHDQL
jgi:hypothetical protein